MLARRLSPPPWETGDCDVMLVLVSLACDSMLALVSLASLRGLVVISLGSICPPLDFIDRLCDVMLARDGDTRPGSRARPSWASSSCT